MITKKIGLFQILENNEIVYETIIVGKINEKKLLSRVFNYFSNEHLNKFIIRLSWLSFDNKQNNSNFTYYQPVKRKLQPVTYKDKEQILKKLPKQCLKYKQLHQHF